MSKVMDADAERPRMSKTTDVEQMSKAMSTEPVDDTGHVHFVPAPCQVACPIGTDAPSYIGYIWERDFVGALEAITATNPFSSVCGRVCDAPCEPACRRADSDGPIAIRNLKRFVMDQLGPGFHLPQVEVSQSQTIGIVGSGPAGLTAAHDLARDGYEVHLYEMSDRLGGMMVWGIPAFRLPTAIIKEDIDRILNSCPGIKVHVNCALGRDITLDELKEKHDAVLLTLGAWWGKKMGIAGEDCAQVVDGVGFLRKINGGERPQMPEHVVVIGGGDVAMDACRVAKRLPGCKQVTVVYRRGPNEIPARRDELEGAIKEGVQFVYNAQQIAVVEGEGGLLLRCVRTESGEADEDGRARPVVVEGSDFTVACGLVIAAVGQRTENAELDERKMMGHERVNTAWESMRTDDAQVFAAGDGAFGPSTLVNAMYHGHRAAYYIKSFLNGEERPPEYRTPYRTYRVPVSQDAMWEVLNRREQTFHGLGKDPVKFLEIESAYSVEEAREEAARCYRCDCENGSSEYTVNNREDLFVMARIKNGDNERARQLLQKRLENRENPFPVEHAASWDDLHFLPANLSRLVIDPYREACKTATRIGELTLASPFLISGFDEVSEAVKEGLAQGMASTCLYLGRAALGDSAPWLQLARPGDELADSAQGIVHDLTGGFVKVEALRATDEQILGFVLNSESLADGIPYALEMGADLLLLDGTAGMGRPWPERCERFDLAVLRDAIVQLRKLKSEERIHLSFLGGIRSGTDAAKAIAMGCSLLTLNMSIALAMHGVVDDGGLSFAADISADEHGAAVENFIKACTGEVSMMARCSGKTNIHSLEPEDLRSITLVTAEATGIPLIGYS